MKKLYKRVYNSDLGKVDNNYLQKLKKKQKPEKKIL